MKLQQTFSAKTQKPLVFVLIAHKATEHPVAFFV